MVRSSPRVPSALSALTSICVALVCAAVAQGQNENPEKALRLSLRLDTNEVLRFEPLRAMVALRNGSSGPMRLDEAYEFRQCLGFFRSYQDGEFEACGEGKESLSFAIGPVVLQPGDELLSPEMLILYVRQKGRDRVWSFVLDRPGNYRLKVRLAFRGTYIFSQPVHVFVKPLPPDHADAAKLIGDMRVAQWIQGWAGSEGAHAKQLRGCDKHSLRV